MFAAHMTTTVCVVGVWGEQKTKGMYEGMSMCNVHIDEPKSCLCKW